MGANFNQLVTVVTDGTIDPAQYNAEFQNIINNFTPAGMDDESATLPAMQATTSPGTVGGESLATSLQGEIQRLRYMIKQIHGGAQWYSYPAFSIRDVARNLVIVNNATHADHQVDVDADEIILQDTNGVPKRVASVNLTVDISATAGANALDTGSEAATTVYHIWVINNGTTTAGLLSTSATAPTMPGGYTFKALVGSIYNGATDFITMAQVGNRVTATGVVAVNAQTGGPTEFTLPAMVPTTAKAWFGYGYTSTTNGILVIGPTAALVNTYIIQNTGGAAQIPIPPVPIVTAQKGYFQQTTAGVVTVTVTGWEY